MDLFLYFFKAYPQRTIFVFFTISVASVITAITLLAFPALLFTLLGRDSGKTQFINDFLTQAGIPPSTENLIIFLIVGITLQSVLLAIANIYAGYTKGKIIKDMRLKLLTSMSKTEWTFFTRQSSGEFTASIINEIDYAGDGYETMVMIVSNFAQIIAYLAVAFFISWEIATIAVITSLVLTILFGRLMRISRDIGKEDKKLIRKITSQLTDSYRSIKPLKAMARESNSHAILNTYTKQLKEVNKKDTLISEIMDMFQEIILMSTIILTIYFSFEYLDLPMAYAIVLVILYLRTMKLFGKTQRQYRSYVGNVSGYHMMMKYMEDALAHQEIRTGTIKHRLQGDILFDKICFRHENKIILDDASATFYHCKLNSIIGPSGEGKTTIADIICGLFQPTSGNILLDGIPLSKIDITYWREQIGYVTQETNLLNSTIKENITLGDPSFSDQDIQYAVIKSHCDSFVSKLPHGLDTLVGENGAHLSGGQRQRILIARALVHHPTLLILDEATSALDSQTELSLSAIFKELSQEITIISISHRPALVEISDHILELNDGSLTDTRHHNKSER